jgi:hypothetical protein
MMSKRENALATYHFEKHDWVPFYGEDVAMAGISVLEVVGLPYFKPRTDMFGVPWYVDRYGQVPEPGFVMFDDIADWEKYVHFPKLDDVDFQAYADAEYESGIINRDEQFISLWGDIGMFTRMHALMGFENCLCALIEDPEECKRFFDALAEYLIDYYDRAINAYKPDAAVYLDDLAAATNLFMSPDCYMEVIEPYQRAVIESIASHDVLAGIHCCGKCDFLIPTWIDEGITVWNPAQSMNDVAAVLDNKNIVCEGGWDSQGPSAQPNATTEIAVEEARRCMTEYKKDAFVFMPLMMSEKGNSMMVEGDENFAAVKQVWEEMKYFD